MTHQQCILGVAPCALEPGEIGVDLFAGAGGWAEGFRQAVGCSPAIAINHDAHSIRCHHRNHPDGEHYCESVYDVDPIRACRGRPVGWLHLSPDCTHHSRAKGGKPRCNDRRALAWIGMVWAQAVAPRIISLENVPEFAEWGPLDDAGKPIKAKARETFNNFCCQLRSLGYAVEHRVLCAADFGAPTIRRRLFLLARRDGLPIRWPEPTHGPGRDRPHRTAAECIDWTNLGRSIFTRTKPLAAATHRRIAHGCRRYVLESGKPYLVTCNHGGDGFRGQGVDRPMCTITASRDAHGLIAPVVTTAPPLTGAYLLRLGHGAKQWNAAGEPLTTILAQGNHHALVAGSLSQFYGGNQGRDLGLPLGTITAWDHHSLVAGSLISYYCGGGQTGAADLPLGAITTHARHGLIAGELSPCADLWRAVRVARFLRRHCPDVPVAWIQIGSRLRPVVGLIIDGRPLLLIDLLLRMLTPDELKRCQGFPADYHIDGTQAQQIARIGNSVPPQFAAAICRANLHQDTP